MNMTVRVRRLLDSYIYGNKDEDYSGYSSRKAYEIAREREVTYFIQSTPTLTLNRNILLELSWNGAVIDYNMFPLNLIC